MAILIYLNMTLDTHAGGDCFLVSYDVSGSARSVAARVCQIVFGRRRIIQGKIREEPGFIHREGVVWIGQSVLAMPPREADALATRLRPLGVRVALAPVAIPQRSLDAFRRLRE